MRHSAHYYHTITFSSRGLRCSTCRRRLDDARWDWDKYDAFHEARNARIAREIRRPGETLKQAAARWYKAGLPAARKLLKKIRG